MRADRAAQRIVDRYLVEGEAVAARIIHGRRILRDKRRDHPYRVGAVGIRVAAVTNVVRGGTTRAPPGRTGDTFTVASIVNRRAAIMPAELVCSGLPGRGCNAGGACRLGCLTGCRDSEPRAVRKKCRWPGLRWVLKNGGSIKSAHDEAVALGARLLKAADDIEADDGFQVYADPAGHPFCLCWLLPGRAPECGRTIIEREDR